MLDRDPDLEAARAAATATLDDEQLADVLDAPAQTVEAPGQAQAHEAAAPPAATAPAASAPPANMLAANREALVHQCTLLVGGLSIKAAERWGAHWAFQPAEAQAVAEASLDVAALYVDNLESPWSRLYLALGMTFIPRLLGPKLPPLGQAAAPASSPAAEPAPASSAEEAKAAA